MQVSVLRVLARTLGVFSVSDWGKKLRFFFLFITLRVHCSCDFLAGIVRGFQATVAASPLNSRTYCYYFNSSLLFLPFLLDELCMTAHREMGGLRYLSVGINSAVTMK